MPAPGESGGWTLEAATAAVAAGVPTMTGGTFAPGDVRIAHTSPTREELLADIAQEFAGAAIVSTFDYRADEVVSVYCLACKTESGHGPACPVPVLEAWLRQPAT